MSIILVTLVVRNSFAQSETHRLTAPVTDYAVYDIQHSNGYSLLKGYFYQAGAYSGSVVSVDGADGTEDLTWPAISGEVYAVIPDGSGGYYAGGAIRGVNNEDVGNLIHIRADKTLDRSFLPNPFGVVYALALQDNILYVGGTFVNVAGQSRNYAAAFDTGTGAITDWNPHLNNRVTAIEVTNDAVVLAGLFTQVNNGAAIRNKIASVSKTTGAVSGWNVTLEGTATWAINAIEASSNMLYIGGSFNKVNGVDRNGLASVSLATGTLDTDWNPSPLSIGTPIVNSLALDGSKLYVAGAFASGIGGDNGIKHLGAVDLVTGNADNAFKPVFDLTDQVYDITLSGETLYAYGSFNSVNGLTRVMLAALSTNNGAPTDFSPRIDGGAAALTTNGNNLLIAGKISGVNWKPYNGLAIIEESTGKFWPRDLEVLSGEDITAMVVNGNTMYVGGYFTSINGISRKNLAAIDLTNGNILPWNPGASGTTTTAFDDTRVTALEYKDNTVYVAGIFLNAGGQSRRGLAAIDATTGAATSWNPGVGDATGMDEYIFSMDIHETSLFVSGRFATLAGEAREFLGAIDLATGELVDWHPQVFDDVREVRVSGSSAFILGDFSSGVGGEIRDFGIAAIDIVTGEATSFNPQFNGGTADFALTDTDIYIGGYFSTSGVEPRPGLASFSLATGELNAWYPDLGSAGEGNYDVATLATSASRLHVGGGFIFIGNENRQGYAEYDLVECAAVATVTLDGTSLLASAGDSYQWYENDVAVPGANSQTFEINIFEYGRYAVEVSSNGCSARSADYIYLVTDREEDKSEEIRIYPNPVVTDFYIEVPQESMLTVTDLSGKPVLRDVLKFNQRNYIATHDWSKGVYVLKVQNAMSSKSFKIIKTN
jgi:hypothetical protein